MVTIVIMYNYRVVTIYNAENSVGVVAIHDNDDVRWGWNNNNIIIIQTHLLLGFSTYLRSII